MSKALAAGRGAGAGLGIATSVAIIVVFLWDFTVPSMPMPAEVGAAIGTVAAYVVEMLRRLLPAREGPRGGTSGTPPAAVALLALALAGGLTACAGLRADIETPQTPREAYIAAEAAYTEALRLATVAAERGWLSDRQILAVDDLQKEGARYLDLAHEKLQGGLVDAAMEWVGRVRGIARQLEAIYSANRAPAPPAIGAPLTAA